MLSRKTNQFVRNSILVIVVAGVYFIFGLLGLVLRNQGDYIGIIMPSAGIALATTLVFGNRALYGIIIGAFCFSALSFDFKKYFILLYVANAIGVALSAFIGARLINRNMDYPTRLLSDKEIVTFMLLGGALGCSISATITVAVMYALDIVLLESLLVSWLGAWMSNLLGVLVFAPLVLTLFAEPQAIWYRRRTTVEIPVMITFSLIILLFFYLKEVEHKQYIEQLKEKTVSLSQVLKERTESNLSSLYGLRNFLLRTQLREMQQFLRLTKFTLLHFKEIQLISWVNKSPNGTGKNQFITLTNTNVYHKPETWWTISSELRQRIVGDSSIKETELLPSEDSSIKWLIPAVKEEINRETLGFIIATVSMETLMQQVLETFNLDNCTIAISAAQNRRTPAKIIFANNTKSGDELFQIIPVSVVGQSWTLSFYYNWNKNKTQNTPTNLILFCGLWFTGLLGIVLLQLTAHYFRNEVTIEERNHLLVEAKTAAELASQTKSQFLAKISHELRTPLNGISGFTQLLEKKPSMGREDKQQLAIIRQCSDNLLKLINDILDISVLEAQQIKVDKNEFNFVNLLTESIQVCKLKADEKGVNLITKNRCVHHEFLGDEKRIRQILVNLTDNAIKYTDKGSVIVTAFYENGLLKITVADTGCGIAQPDLEHIFSPFVQVGGGNNFSREGIGLGLSITKELINIMDGELAVSSQPNVGSIFSVSLPLLVSVTNYAVVKESFRNKTTKTAKASVLVVDDSEINLLFLTTMLEQIGCSVDSAGNGQEALALIKKNNYDLALIDINMPVLNGLDLAKIISQQQITLKLVAISAYINDDKIKEAIAAGFDVYLTKPLEEHQLIELVQSVYEPITLN